VVDDESTQRKGLQGILQQLCPECEVMAASNGAEACALLERHTFWLVLSDIRMPVMDGLELLQVLYERYPGIKVILVSAYQDFEYAKTAIRFKAVDYLIKPFRVTDVEKLITKVRTEFELELDVENRLEDYVRREEQRLLQQLLLDGRLNGEHAKLLKPLSDLGVVACLFWHSGETGMGTRLTQILAGYPSFIPVTTQQPDINLAVLIVGKSAAMARKALEEVISACRSEWGLELFIGLSATVSSLEIQAREAYVQAEKALSLRFYYAQGRVFSYEETAGYQEHPLPSLSEEAQVLRRLIEENSSGIPAALACIKKKLLREQHYNPHKLRQHVFVMMFSVINSYQDISMHKEFNALQQYAYEQMGLCDSYESLFEICERILEKCAVFHRNITDTDAVGLVIEYIRENFRKELSLSEIAEVFHFNPNYLSTIIKAKIGKPYSVFLLELRLAEAGQLLSGTDRKVQDIAVHCGFGGISYFNRVFRREHSMSPEQYRRKFVRAGRRRDNI
jgi:YesN/AraC family two-component response regulator